MEAAFGKGVEPRSESLEARFAEQSKGIAKIEALSFEDCFITKRLGRGREMDPE